MNIYIWAVGSNVRLQFLGMKHAIFSKEIFTELDKNYTLKKEFDYVDDIC